MSIRRVIGERLKEILQVKIRRNWNQEAGTDQPFIDLVVEHYIKSKTTIRIGWKRDYNDTDFITVAFYEMSPDDDCLNVDNAFAIDSDYW